MKTGDPKTVTETDMYPASSYLPWDRRGEHKILLSIYSIRKLVPLSNDIIHTMPHAPKLYFLMENDVQYSVLFCHLYVVLRVMLIWNI